MLITSLLTVALGATAAHAGCQTPLASPLSVAKLTQKLSDCQIRSVDDALPLMPQELKENYVLVYSGRGLQRGSETHPRSIMFEKSGEFAVSFNGHESLRGYRDLETMEWDATERRLRYRVIHFPEDGSGTVIAEPPVCLNCHGRENPRPIWETGPLWPGVYGSENDDLFTAGTLDSTSEELKNYEAYLSLRPNNRYRHLVEMKDGAQPNLEFDRAMMNVNAKVVAKIISETPELQPYRYAVLATLMCDEAAENFLTPRSMQKFVHSQATMSSDLLARIQKDFEFRLKRHARTETTGLKSPELRDVASLETSDLLAKRIDDPARISRLRHIVENVSSHDVGRWSMASPASTHSFGEAGQFTSRLKNELAEIVLRSDSDLYFKVRTSSSGACESLKSKSLAELALY